MSVQVLQEYYVTVTRKLAPGLDGARVQEHVRRYLTWDPLATDGPVLEDAWAAEERFRLSWWDALIVAAAHRQGCGHLLTEDLADGRDLDGVRVVNPFAHAPEEVLGA